MLAGGALALDRVTLSVAATDDVLGEIARLRPYGFLRSTAPGGGAGAKGGPPLLSGAAPSANGGRVVATDVALVSDPACFAGRAADAKARDLAGLRAALLDPSVRRVEVAGDILFGRATASDADGAWAPGRDDGGRRGSGGGAGGLGRLTPLIVSRPVELRACRGGDGGARHVIDMAGARGVLVVANGGALRLSGDLLVKPCGPGQAVGGGGSGGGVNSSSSSSEAAAAAACSEQWPALPAVSLAPGAQLAMVGVVIEGPTPPAWDFGASESAGGSGVAPAVWSPAPAGCAGRRIEVRRLVATPEELWSRLTSASARRRRRRQQRRLMSAAVGGRRALAAAATAAAAAAAEGPAAGAETGAAAGGGGGGKGEPDAYYVFADVLLSVGTSLGPWPSGGGAGARRGPRAVAGAVAGGVAGGAALAALAVAGFVAARRRRARRAGLDGGSVKPLLPTGGAAAGGFLPASRRGGSRNSSAEGPGGGGGGLLSPRRSSGGLASQGAQQHSGRVSLSSSASPQLPAPLRPGSSGGAGESGGSRSGRRGERAGGAAAGAGVGAHGNLDATQSSAIVLASAGGFAKAAAAAFASAGRRGARSAQRRRSAGDAPVGYAPPFRGGGGAIGGIGGIGGGGPGGATSTFSASGSRGGRGPGGGAANGNGASADADAAGAALDADRQQQFERAARAVRALHEGGGGGTWRQGQEDIVLGEVLGAGTFGRVFKATWKGSMVAVKRMLFPAGMSGAAKRERMAIMETAVSRGGRGGKRPPARRRARDVSRFDLVVAALCHSSRLAALKTAAACTQTRARARTHTHPISHRLPSPPNNKTTT